MAGPNEPDSDAPPALEPMTHDPSAPTPPSDRPAPRPFVPTPARPAPPAPALAVAAVPFAPRPRGAAGGLNAASVAVSPEAEGADEWAATPIVSIESLAPDDETSEAAAPGDGSVPVAGATSANASASGWVGPDAPTGVAAEDDVVPIEWLAPDGEASGSHPVETEGADPEGAAAGNGDAAATSSDSRDGEPAPTILTGETLDVAADAAGEVDHKATRDWADAATDHSVADRSPSDRSAFDGVGDTIDPFATRSDTVDAEGGMDVAEPADATDAVDSADSAETVVPVESLAPDASGDHDPEHRSTDEAHERQIEGVGSTILPGWEEWEADAERMTGESRETATPDASPAASSGDDRGVAHDGGDEFPPATWTGRPPFPADVFGFPDVPSDFNLPAARGVADPGAWPTDEEWRQSDAADGDQSPDEYRGGTQHVDAGPSGRIDRSEHGDPSYGLERSDAGAAAWGRSGAGSPERAPVEASVRETDGASGSGYIAASLERLAGELRAGAFGNLAGGQDEPDSVHLTTLLLAVIRRERSSR